MEHYVVGSHVFDPVVDWTKASNDCVHGSSVLFTLMYSESSTEEPYIFAKKHPC